MGDLFSISYNSLYVTLIHAKSFLFVNKELGLIEQKSYFESS